MNLETTLTGFLAAILIAATVATAFLSLVLVWLYRRATLRGMDELSGVAKKPPKPPIATNPDTSLVIRSPGPGNELAKRTTAFDRAASRLRSATLLYAIACGVYAVVFTIPWIAGAGGFNLGRFFWLTVCLSWVGVIVLIRVSSTHLQKTLTILGGYFLIVLAVAGWVVARNDSTVVAGLAFFWFYVNGSATLLLLGFLFPKIRAVGSLVLVIMMAGMTGANLVVYSNEATISFFATLGNHLGLEAQATFYLMQGLGFLPLALVGWFVLLGIGRLYRAKYFSDLSLNLDAHVILFAVVHSIQVTSGGVAWFLTGLVAFVGYKLVLILGFSLLRKGKTKPVHLLLLRVFALKERSERFFNGFAKHWRRTGTLQLIAGPDLITSVMQPHQFLDFVSGKHGRQFVKDEADLEERLGRRDLACDPDATFRITDFYCRADTWKRTMQRLAESVDVVLMDLRSFSRDNQGCVYEIEQLLDKVDLERITFLIDHTTDRQFLEEVLQTLWARLSPDSPNRIKEAVACIIDTSIGTRKAIRLLFYRLYGVPRLESTS